MTNWQDNATYKSWRAMKRRCAGKASNSRYYVGIRVCDRWQVFANFLADMGERPEGMTLDRIDVSGHYCKENCRWATTVQQMRNKTTNHVIAFQGESLCLAEWSERLGVCADNIRDRIKKGWPLDQVLRPKSIRHHINGRKRKSA